MNYQSIKASLYKSKAGLRFMKPNANHHKLIRKIYKKRLNQEIWELVDISKGYKNRVYLVKTNRERSVIKIAQNVNNINEKYQVHRELWASTAWKQVDIPVPNCLVFDDSRNLINFDYIIESVIPGRDLSELQIDDLDFRKIMQDLGRQMKRMHRIKAKKFGVLVGDLQGHSERWNFLEKAILSSPHDLFEKGVVTKEQERKVSNYFLERRHILDYADPKLLHNDVQMNNLIVQNNRLSGIVDLGDAMAGDPAYDLARTYQSFSDSSHVNELTRAYGHYNKESFEYYLLYHACWTAGFFFKHQRKDRVRSSQRLIMRFVGG